MQAAMLVSFPIRFVRMLAVELRRTSLAAYWLVSTHSCQLRCLTITRLADGDFASEDAEKLGIRVRGLNTSEDLYWIGLGWRSILKKSKPRTNQVSPFYPSGLSRLGYVTPLRDGA